MTPQDAQAGLTPSMQTNPCPECGTADRLIDNQCGCCIVCAHCDHTYPKQRVAK